MEKERSHNKEHKKGDRQVNQYDKILRDNRAKRRLRTRRSVAKQLRRSSEAALPGLIRNLLNIHAVNSEELPDDIQHTKERKPDVLKKVTDKKGETFVLHIEFQVKN